MKVQQLLAHHGIKENPFGQEDAQSDQVFKRHCLEGTHHPAWDKIFGSPEEPSTAVVFGEKGAGKTALRLQIVDQIDRYNREHPDRRVLVIEYDDFNPFLDCFRDRLFGRQRRPERALASWRLWDHMDAILTLGVSRLTDGVLGAANGGFDGFEQSQLDSLTRLQRRDLLLLAAFYDRSLAMARKQRWNTLRRKLKFKSWTTEWDRALGIAVVLAVVGVLAYYNKLSSLIEMWQPWVIILAGWLPWLYRHGRLFWKALNVRRQVRVAEHHPNLLRQLLSRIPQKDLLDQPVPNKDRSDDRYELLNKFQSVLKSLGYAGIVVLVDRVDEPHLINGSAERMRDLLWPMFDNKFLKHPGIGFKLLLPVEVSYHLAREDKEFFERSRLDKQNLIRSLQWSGESLYDVANDRLRACADANSEVTFRNLFDESVSEAELIATIERLRVPRHLFKFIYRLLVDHCNRYTDNNPRWTISRETLQSTLAVYMRDLQEFDRGQGTG
ncbi:MAG: hypothetical protein JSS02_03725 [Planctomycetes bacterium]|nr:hypothetical protein [Planctomycetota bacterium]